MSNLVLLCGYHHRLLHDLGYSIIATSPGAFRFLRPDGTHIKVAPPITGQARLDQLPPRLHDPPKITPKTTTPYWAGERINLAYVISFLFPPDPVTPWPDQHAVVS